MHYQAWFRCISGEHGQWSLEDVIYSCPTCGRLLEVAHDLDALRDTRPNEAIRRLRHNICAKNEIIPVNTIVTIKSLQSRSMM